MIWTANSAESSNTSGTCRNPNPGALLKLKLKVHRNPPFVCARCKRTFPTIYALGGHQNAHRRERNEERWASMEERRRKKLNETAPILRRTPSVVVNAASDGQVVEGLATPAGLGHGPMPSFEPSGSNHESRNVQGMRRDYLAVANNNEFVEDNGLLWGITHGTSYDNQNYLMYSYKLQPMPDQEQDLDIERDFLGLMLGRQGAGWLREFPQDAADNSQIDQVTSKRDLDLTLRL